MRKIPEKDYCLLRIGQLDESIMEMKKYFDENAGKEIPENQVEKNLQLQRCAIIAISTRRKFAKVLQEVYGITVMGGWES